MAMDNNRLRILKKVLDTGCTSEKEIIALSTKDMIQFCKSITEVSDVLELQDAVKANRLIAFLSTTERTE